VYLFLIIYMTKDTDVELEAIAFRDELKNK